MKRRLEAGRYILLSWDSVDLYRRDTFVPIVIQSCSV
jgi:hypothetical protein